MTGSQPNAEVNFFVGANNVPINVSWGDRGSDFNFGVNIDAKLTAGINVNFGSYGGAACHRQHR